MRQTRIVARILAVLLLFSFVFHGCGVPQQEPNDEKADPVVPNQTSSSNVNKELKDTMLFCIKRSIKGGLEQLVAVTKDGSEIVILPNVLQVIPHVAGSRLGEFDYFQNRIYIYYGKGELGFIDLNSGDGNYTVTHLASTGQDALLIDFVALSDVIYFSYISDALYTKYSVADNEFTKTSLSPYRAGILKPNRTGENAAYLAENGDLKLIDVLTGNELLIDTNANLDIFIYKNKVIYSKKLDNELNGAFVYCEYDIASGAITQISRTLSLKSGRDEKAYIAPYEDGYIYLDEGETTCRIFLYQAGKYEVIAEVTEWVYLSFLSRTSVSLISAEGMDDGAGDRVSKLLNLQDNTVTDASFEFYYIFDVWVEGF